MLLIAPFRQSTRATSGQLPTPSPFEVTVKRLRDAANRDERQMLPIAAIRDAQLEHGSGTPPHQRLRSGAASLSRPSRARLEARAAARRELFGIDLVGRAPEKRGVRTLGVVPGDVLVELTPERRLGERDDRQEAHALVLQRLDEALIDALMRLETIDYLSMSTSTRPNDSGRTMASNRCRSPCSYQFRQINPQRQRNNPSQKGSRTA